MDPIVFTNLTRDIEIGANCYALEVAGRRVVLDAGMHPRAEDKEATPQLELLPDDWAEAIFLTHAHHDHIGSLPVLMRRHPGAPVFMTDATRRLGDVMLHNSVNVMTRRTEEGDATGVLFTHREVEIGFKRWRGVPLRQRFDLTGERLRPGEPAEVACELFDAGHILGSCGVLLEMAGRRIFYTGDVNFEDQTVMQAARFPEEPVDLLIIESTRGDYRTPEGFSRKAEEQRFGQAIADGLSRGGSIFIPLFALGKTQEILAMLDSFMRARIVPEVPIYIGGLSTKLTEIYDRLASHTPRQLSGMQLMDIDGLFTLSGPEAVSTAIKPRRIYALSSGMMSENTLSNRLARQILSEPKHSLFFVGYADPSSPAGVLKETAPGDEVRIDPGFPPQPLLCQVDSFSFSGHATRESILAYVQKVQPKVVVLVHGDSSAIGWMQKTLQENLPDTRVMSAPPGVAMSF